MTMVAQVKTIGTVNIRKKGSHQNNKMKELQKD